LERALKVVVQALIAVDALLRIMKGVRLQFRQGAGGSPIGVPRFDDRLIGPCTHADVQLHGTGREGGE
jgi:hypothetical protein